MSDDMPSEFFALDEQYETKIFIADRTFTKSYRVPRANTGLPQHSHDYSHTSYFAAGSAKYWIDGVYGGIVRAPDGILIAAHTQHLFQTLEDNTVLLCIHALEDGGEPKIQVEHVVKVRGKPSTPRVPLDGFTFQEEEYDAWLADAQPLFREHMAVTSQSPEGAMMKNIALGRQLASSGAMLVTTARSNGKLFAYLLSVISPTLDEAGVLTAHLMLPFASRDCPGVGKKLQSATIEMLRAKGVSQVYARAGIRGDGPRLGSLYKRLGFIDDGALYRLNLIAEK